MRDRHDKEHREGHVTVRFVLHACRYNHVQCTVHGSETIGQRLHCALRRARIGVQDSKARADHTGQSLHPRQPTQQPQVRHPTHKHQTQRHNVHIEDTTTIKSPKENIKQWLVRKKRLDLCSTNGPG